MLPLQTLNALGGAVCVAALFCLCRHLTRSTFTALLAAGGFAVCGGLWLTSTEAEFVTVPLALELLVLGQVLKLTRSATPGGQDRGRGPILALGASIGVCALVYLSTAALLPAAVLGLRGERRNARQWAAAALWLIAGFAVPVAAGVLVAISTSGSLGAIDAVLRPGSGYGALTWESLPRGCYAFARTLVLFPGLGINDRTVQWRQTAAAASLAAFAATYAVAGLAVATPPILAYRRRLRCAGMDVLLVWALLHAAFCFDWVPSDLSLWIPVTAAWWLLLARVVDVDRSAQLLTAGAVLALLLVNGLGLILPHHYGEATHHTRGRQTEWKTTAREPGMRMRAAPSALATVPSARRARRPGGSCLRG